MIRKKNILGNIKIIIFSSHPESIFAKKITIVYLAHSHIKKTLIKVLSITGKELKPFKNDALFRKNVENTPHLIGCKKELV